MTPGPKASSLNSPAVLLRELRLTGRKRGAIKPQAHTVLLSTAVAHLCGPPHSLGRKTHLLRKAREPRGMVGAQGNASSLGAQMRPSGVKERAQKALDTCHPAAQVTRHILSPSRATSPSHVHVHVVSPAPGTELWGHLGVGSQQG